MPDWKIISDTGRYWWEAAVQAFWDALLFFFETRTGIFRAIGLIVLGMLVTTLIVWLVRSPEAFTEHLKSNVAMVIAGGVASWVLVFVCYFVAVPLQQLQELVTELGKAEGGVRSATIAQQGAERREHEMEKLKQPKQCIVSGPQIVVPPQGHQPSQPGQCVIAERQFPGQMFIARRDQQVRNVGLAVNAFTYLLPELPSSLGGASSGCHLKITAPKENTETAQTLYEMASLIRCHVDYRASNDLQPEIENEALSGAENNTVTVHAPKGDQRYDNFAARLSLIVHVKRKYDAINEGKPDQTIWLQIGPGFPWHIENTYVSIIGGR